MIPTEVRDKQSWKDLKELDSHGQNLTQWEIDFMESLLQRLKIGLSLTDKQKQTLYKIREDRLD